MFSLKYNILKSKRILLQKENIVMNFFILTLLFHTLIEPFPYVPERIPREYSIELRLADSDVRDDYK